MVTGGLVTLHNARYHDYNGLCFVVWGFCWFLLATLNFRLGPPRPGMFFLCPEGLASSLSVRRVGALNMRWFLCLVGVLGSGALKRAQYAALFSFSFLLFSSAVLGYVLGEFYLYSFRVCLAKVLVRSGLASQEAPLSVYLVLSEG